MLNGDPQERRSLLAVPTRGSVDISTLARLEEQRGFNHLPPIVYSDNYLSVFQSRNEIVGFALSEDYDCLVMVDSDVILPAIQDWSVRSLIDLTMKFDVIGASYPIYQPATAPIPLPAAYEETDDSEWKALGDGWEREGVHEVHAVGFGCVALNLRTLMQKLPRERRWFNEEYANGKPVSDDLAFCRYARQHGATIACAFDLQCDHFRAVPLLQLMRGVGEVFERDDDEVPVA